MFWQQDEESNEGSRDGELSLPLWGGAGEPADMIMEAVVLVQQRRQEL